jgi:Abortive infection C-terminus
MTLDWYPGLRSFCRYWDHAEMLQQTFAALEQEFANDNDACIDAAKGIVECACRIIIDELDDPAHPLKPVEADPPIGVLVGTANRLLKLSDIRHRKFADLVKHHNNITDSLRELRNEAGTVSHGKDGFVAKLSAHHRRAAVLSADAIVTYLHEAYLETNFNLSQTREPYERFETFNGLIDNAVSVEVETDDDGDLAVKVHLPGGDILPITASPSRFLYQMDRAAYIEALNAVRSVVPPPEGDLV